jgi:hypothetical protein
MIKKVSFLALCVMMVSALMLWGAQANSNTDAEENQVSYDPDAKINPNPAHMRPEVDDGRALGDVLMTINLASIGVPAPGYSGAGITWDGTFLYYDNQNDQRIYVIDPTGPTLVSSWPIGLSGPWGVGSESLIWVTDYTNNNIYEYTWTGSATGNSFYCNAGGASWMGDASEWWPNGEMWILAVGGTSNIYKFSIPGGTKLDSLADPAWNYISQRALTYDPHNNTFWLGGWNVGTVWEIDGSTGAVLRQFNPSDYAIAGLAYDWQSTLHPTPVLWLTTNNATDNIYMIDADNPQPPPPENILYVDDDEDDVTETYWEASFANLFYPITKWVAYDSGAGPDSAAMADYTIVVWSTGGDYGNTLTGPEATEIGNWLAAGGKLWLSSQDVLYDYGSAPWMHLAGWEDDAGMTNGTGIDIVMSPLSFATGEGAFYDYTDLLDPDGTSWSSVVNDDYSDTSSIAMDTTVGLPYFLYFNAFGWENITDPAYRDSMMCRVLTWMGYPPPFPTHDVGATAIVDPGGNIMPNTTINPQATYRNFGEETDTFDIHFEIYESGTPVYSETEQMILPAASGSTFTFPTQWTSGLTNGIVYDITAYTVMAGDVNPANDTTTSTCITQSFYWKIYSDPMPAANYYHATAYCEAGAPTVYSLGGVSASGLASSIYEFDVATETWSTPSATLNHDAQRNAAASVGDKVYSIGGCDAAWTAHGYVQEYDPVAGTVTDKATMPTARFFHGTVAWRDTLIYAIAGQAGSYYSTVEIYDPANDNWTTGATALPTTNRSFSCGIYGDTIYVAGGYNGAYIASAYMGVIDSLNPTTIAWSAIDNIPTGASGTAGRSRLQGACANTGLFYFTCGDDHGVPTYDTWYWDGSAWAAAPDKPTAISNTQCAVFVPTLDGGTFFCPGGYNTATSSGTTATEGLINVGVGTEEQPGKTAALVFGLSQNAPNPVRNGYTAISYTTNEPGRVSLKIYDKTGRLVRTLRDRNNDPAGQRTVYWDCKDDNRHAVAAGVYFYRLTAGSSSATKKIVIIK